MGHKWQNVTSRDEKKNAETMDFTTVASCSSTKGPSNQLPVFSKVNLSQLSDDSSDSSDPLSSIFRPPKANT
eukprot:3393359-Prorocentrum_lima.AAC.1